MSASCIRCGVDLEVNDCRFCTRCCDILAEHKQTSKPPDDEVCKVA